LSKIEHDIDQATRKLSPYEYFTERPPAATMAFRLQSRLIVSGDHLISFHSKKSLIHGPYQGETPAARAATNFSTLISLLFRTGAKFKDFLNGIGQRPFQLWLAIHEFSVHCHRRPDISMAQNIGSRSGEI
jgi:hypothetical protein